MSEPQSNEQQPVNLWRIVGLRLLELVILGTLTAGAIYAAIQPALIYLAGAGGGLYASRLYGWVRGNAKLRAWVDAHYLGRFALKPQELAAGLLAWAFYSQATAAAVVAVLSAVFSAVAVGVIAYFDNDSLDKALAAFVAFLFSQIIYFLNHPAPGPTTTPAEAAEAAPAAAQ